MSYFSKVKEKYYILFSFKSGILSFLFAVSCLYVWPIGAVWIDKFAIVLVVLVAFCHKNKFKSKKVNFSWVFLPICTVCYWILRDISALSLNFRFDSLRIVISNFLLLVCLVLLLYKKHSLLEYAQAYNISLFYSILQLINFVLFKLSGEDWSSWQGRIISGSTIASIPLFISSVLIARTFSNKGNIREIVLLSLLIINGISYQSRLTLLLVFFCLFLIAIKAQVRISARLKFLIPFIVVLVFGSFIGASFKSHSPTNASADTEVAVDISLTAIANYMRDVSESALFLAKSRESDSDRSLHLTCGLKFLSKRTGESLLFGSGVNSYKYEIIKCKEFGGADNINSEIEYIGRGSRSISVTILIIDYGLVGLFLLILAVVTNFFQQVRNKMYYDLVLSVLILSMLFTSNVTGILLVWLIIFFTFSISNIKKQFTPEPL